MVIGKSAGAVQRVEPVFGALTEAGVEYATFSVSGEPTLEVVRMGTQRARDEHCDLVIGFGGGSVMDTGKAIAVLLTNGGDPLDYLEVIGKGQPLAKESAPHVAIPTTAGTGSEVTRNAVLGSPEQRAKVSMRSPFMLPRVALVDPEADLRFAAATHSDDRHGCADAIDRGVCVDEGEPDDRRDLSGGHAAGGAVVAAGI